MSQTKVEILKVTPFELNREYQKIHDGLLRSKPRVRSVGLKYFDSLPEHDQKYLSLWFAEHVLYDLDEIKQKIDSIENEKIRDFMLVALSNILRTVSYQKESDLRVRKEMKVDTDLDAIREFLEELGRSVRIILAFLYQNQKTKLGNYQIFEGNALDIPTHWKKYIGRVDVIITSPPYATALPYLDTDRLSLGYLGLLTRSKQASQNLEMIGNREITDSIRKRLWDSYNENKKLLPSSIVKIVDLIEKLNKNSDVGFRRKNLSALLGKYFLDMQRVFEGMHLALKPGSHAYVVIGNNHTIAGNKRIEIETTTLLSDLAKSVGFTPLESLPMEMLVSRDIFRKNAVASEFILDLQKTK
jgi:site-specific DNA-methyltransferase (cytosine-N4-specific)